MKNILEIDGQQYVGSREIEKHFGLSKNKAWRWISAGGLSHIVVAQTFFYPVNDVITLFEKKGYSYDN
jgi:hypothetical protein